MTNFCKILLALFLLPGFVLSAFGNGLTNVNLTPEPAGIALITGVPTYPPAVGLLPPATGLKASHPARRTKAGDPDKLSADPIRFSIQCDKRQINLNEEVTLTITAQLLTVSSSQLFFVPGTNDYTLKLILPPGFEQTGGDFTDYVAGTLSAASRPVITYRVRGRFRAVTPGTSFRLLRSHGQANDQSLFAEKSTLVLQSLTPETSVSRLRKGAVGPLNPANQTLYVVADNTVNGSARSAASEYRGYVDHADCDNVTGWIVDGSNPRQSQEVDIYINGTKAATVLANQTRQDVANATGSRDFNQYGYVWVIPDYYRTNAPLTVSIKPAGVGADLGASPRQTSACPGVGAAPTTPSPVPTPPAAPTPAGTLTMLPPTYDCATGAIRFNTSGGDGSSIRFRSPGITGWTTNPNQYLDAGARVHDDTPPFIIYVEQSGRAITYAWSRQATCNGSTPPPATPAPPTTPTPAPPTPPTTPVADGACGSGINVIKYAWDGGNNSVSIQINASAGSPQIKLSGPANVDWTNAFNLGNSVWYWGNQGMSTGNYTLSVRQPGGADCSFSFSVPSAGRQLYPATGGNPSPTPAPTPSPGCTPPSAPTLSAPGGTQVCNNSAVTLTAAGCNGTVTWSGGQSGSSISVNAAGTYSATCSLNGCTSGASNQLTVTTCAPPVSNGRYNRVLYVGNSITLHGGSPFFIVNGQNPKRGMAATSPDKDYVRLMSAKHRELNGGVDNRTLASWNLGGQLDEATGPFWEGNSTKNGVDLGRFDPVTAWKPDLVYIRLGENVADEEITNQSLYQNRLKELIDKLIAQSPGAKVVLSTSVWGRPNYDRAIHAVAAERNYPIADFSDMWPNRFTNGYYAINPSIYGDSGTDNHPDDDGMAHMANALWNATPK